MTLTPKDVSWMLLLVFATCCLAVPPCAKSRCIKYTVLTKRGDYELREYEPSNWASFLYNFNKNHPLKELNDYLDGHNDDGKNLPHADPILIRISNITNIATLSVLLPPGDNPKPNSPDINLESYGKLTFHTLPFEKSYQDLKRETGTDKNFKYMFSAIYINYSEIGLMQDKGRYYY